MAGQYTSQAHGCLLQSFRWSRKARLTPTRGRQEANANFETEGQNREKPKNFTEFSIDTQNPGA